MAFDLDNHISKTRLSQKGITFYDISPALEDAEVLTQLMAEMITKAQTFEPDIIAGIDTGAFYFRCRLPGYGVRYGDD